MEMVAARFQLKKLWTLGLFVFLSACGQNIDVFTKGTDLEWLRDLELVKVESPAEYYAIAEFAYDASQEAEVSARFKTVDGKKAFSDRERHVVLPFLKAYPIDWEGHLHCRAGWTDSKNWLLLQNRELKRVYALILYPDWGGDAPSERFPGVTKYQVEAVDD